MVPKISAKFDIMANYNKKLGYHRHSLRDALCQSVVQQLTGF